MMAHNRKQAETYDEQKILLGSNGHTEKNGRQFDKDSMAANEADTQLLNSSSKGEAVGAAVEPFDVEEEVALRENGLRDRLKLVYWIMIIHGVGVLMPWNMFITAQDYFIQYKFGGRCTDYSRNFLSYLGVCAQLPNVLLNGLNFVFHFGGSLTKRIVFCICIIIAIFIMTAVLAMVDSSNWPGGVFFAITMVSIAILNSATGVYQNCVYGVAAWFPFSYTNAVIMGNNLSGTWTAIILIITIAASPSQRTAAIYYFLTAVVVLLICLDSYFILPHCRFYR
jgi:equilibrative nucleoside transporter 1/2/3